jgi:hypothetical protein
LKIINQNKNTVLAEDVIIADTPAKRMKGLLDRHEFKKGQAIILAPCNSVHTFFMRFPIDVVFIDRKNQVVKVISNLKPWRLSGIYPSACSCIELPANSIISGLASLGDFIAFF